MTYRELQTALKNLRNAGYDIQVKLTASFDTLQAEYNRLTAIATQDSLEQPQPQQVMTTDSFNEWVGLPYEQTTQQHSWGNEPTTKKPSEQLEERAEKLPPKPLEALQDKLSKGLTASEQIEVKPETSFRVDLTYSTNLPQNEPYSHQENSKSLVQQGLKFICINHPANSYWIDGTELGQNLNHTQAQALRNLEDGINWLLKLPGRLKAFESGFREGLKNTPVKQQARLKQSNVIPIERSHRLPKPLPIPLVA